MRKYKYSSSDKQIIWGYGSQRDSWTKLKQLMIFGVYIDDLAMDEDDYWLPCFGQFIDVFKRLISSQALSMKMKNRVKSQLSKKSFNEFDSALISAFGLWGAHSFYYHANRSLSSYAESECKARSIALTVWWLDNGIDNLDSKDSTSNSTDDHTAITPLFKLITIWLETLFKSHLDHHITLWNDRRLRGVPICSNRFLNFT